MCFNCSKNSRYTYAKEDIIVYKQLATGYFQGKDIPKGEGRSPYQHFDYTYGEKVVAEMEAIFNRESAKEIKSIKINHLLNDRPFLEMERPGIEIVTECEIFQGLHAYTNPVNRIWSDIEMHLAYIPKGAYYVTNDKSEIVSNELIVIGPRYLSTFNFIHNFLKIFDRKRLRKFKKKLAQKNFENCPNWKGYDRSLIEDCDSCKKYKVNNNGTLDRIS